MTFAVDLGTYFSFNVQITICTDNIQIFGRYSHKIKDKRKKIQHNQPGFPY